MVCVDMLLYVRCGFALPHIRALWRSLKLEANLTDIVWQSFDLIKLTCAHLVVPVGAQEEALEDLGAYADWLNLAARSGYASSLGVVAGVWKAMQPRRPRAAPASDLADALGDFFLQAASRQQPVLHPVIAQYLLQMVDDAIRKP